MRLQGLLSTFIIGIGVFLGAGSAAAAEPASGEGNMRMPLAQAERPLTLPRLTLAPKGEIEVGHVPPGLPGEKVTSFGIAVGARFGILDDLEVGATFAPIEFVPEVGYVLPRIDATYRFLKGDVEIGANLAVTILTDRPLISLIPVPIGANRGVAIQPGIPMRFHLGKSARLDTGVYVPIGIGSLHLPPPLPAQPTQVGVGLRIPVEFLFDIIEPLHVAANTGFGIGTFKDAGHSVYVPLGFSMGYAIGGEKGPIVDLDPFFQWPALFVPGSNGDRTFPGAFVTGLEVTGYVYL